MKCYYYKILKIKA